MLFGPNATAASDARSKGPPKFFVRPGSKPRVQVLPPSNVVAYPFVASPPAATRPDWNAVTALRGSGGLALIDGSISVSSWMHNPPALVVFFCPEAQRPLGECVKIDACASRSKTDRRGGVDAPASTVRTTKTTSIPAATPQLRFILFCPIYRP